MLADHGPSIAASAASVYLGTCWANIPPYLGEIETTRCIVLELLPRSPLLLSCQKDVSTTDPKARSHKEGRPTRESETESNLARRTGTFLRQ